MSLSPEALAGEGESLALPEQRRQQILAAARRSFSRFGFHGASMHQICAEARMSPGAVYRYFPSKDRIIEAIAEEERLAATACMSGLVGAGSLSQRITAVAMNYLRTVRDPETGGLMVEICSESLRNTAVGERFREIEANVRQAMRHVLEQAREAGETAPDIDVEAVLAVLMSLGDGLAMRLQIERDIDLDAVEPCLSRMLAALVGETAR